VPYVADDADDLRWLRRSFQLNARPIGPRMKRGVPRVMSLIDDPRRRETVSPSSNVRPRTIGMRITSK
jgi:hypothetical protein